MPPSALKPFLDHIERSNNVALPGTYVPFTLDRALIGWVSRDLAVSLTTVGLKDESGHLELVENDSFEALGQRMATAGLYRPHDELFDVIDPQGLPVGRIDRGALPLLGLEAQGVHVNGLVRTEAGLHLWIGHRALTKRLDPGKLDHLVAGGVCAGISPSAALRKEAEEEAAILPELADQAVPVGEIRYAMARPEGLRRDILHCYDLFLPATFEPRPTDGEVAYFELMPIDAVFTIVRDTDRFKFNVNLVLIDLFLRLGLFADDDAAILRRALSAQP